MEIKRGEVYFADLDPIVGSEQGGIRPVVILQNNVGNIHSPTTIVAVITSKTEKNDLPTHIKFTAFGKMPKDSMVELEQIKTIDKSRLISKVGEFDRDMIKDINRALRISILRDWL